MKVGFPHGGNIYIPLRTLFRELGVDCVVPPPNSKRSLNLGTKYSPEGACLPFKLTLGNLIEACEEGADLLVQARGFGICRLGYYTRIQEPILHDLGYDAEVMKFTLSENFKFIGILKLFKRICDGASWLRILRAYHFGMSKFRDLDEIERLVQRVRPRELERGSANRLFLEATHAIDDADSMSSLKRIKKDYIEKLKGIPQDPDADPITVGIAGEIYVVLEPFANMDIEVELGKLGVEVRRKLSYYQWAKYNFYLNPLGINEWRAVRKAAYPYLRRDVGGDGWESVGEKVLYSQEYDGMIHLFPFTCMPETVAQNIMSSTKEHIPVLSIACDEQMGKVGMLTRLEAFVDLLEHRHCQKRRGTP